MKKKRLTLEEIKVRFVFLERGFNESSVKEAEHPQINIDSLTEQIRRLEVQLTQLKPMVTDLKTNKAAQLSKQIMYQSITVIQTLMIFLSDIEPMI